MKGERVPYKKYPERKGVAVPRPNACVQVRLDSLAIYP